MKLTILGVDFPVSDKVIYATEEASREYINAMNYNQKDHSHCPPKNSPCGNEGEHRCCLCLKPKELSNRRMYQLGYDEGCTVASKELVGKVLRIEEEKIRQEERLAVLSEVEREVEKKLEYDLTKCLTEEEIFTIITNLKVK